MHKSSRLSIFAAALLAAVLCSIPAARLTILRLNTRINLSLQKGIGYLLAKKEDGEHWANLQESSLVLYAAGGPPLHR